MYLAISQLQPQESIMVEGKLEKNNVHMIIQNKSNMIPYVNRKNNIYENNHIQSLNLSKNVLNL